MAKRDVIKNLHSFYGGDAPPDPPPEHLGLVWSEKQFVRYAKAKGRQPIIRAGWPDFIMHTAEGKPVFVEVKQDREDRLRPSQIRTFKALQRAGITVYVWSPPTADKLIPWDKW